MAAIVKLKADQGVYINGALVKAEKTRGCTIRIVSEDAGFLRETELLPENLPKTPLFTVLRRVQDMVIGHIHALDAADKTLAMMKRCWAEYPNDKKLGEIYKLLADQEDYKAFKALKMYLLPRTAIGSRD